MMPRVEPAVLTATMMERYIETAFAQKVSELPTRYLPPGTVKMLFHEFSLTSPSISYVTFWRRFQSTWRNILRFTPESDHSTCDTCLDCKERFKTASDLQSKFDTAKLYKTHLAGVSADRELEEWFQVHGLWIHGVSLNLYVVHPGVAADSTLICECFARALQDTFETFESAQMRIPKECLIWADNTVRENKNNVAFKMMTTLLGKGLMSCAGIFFARTGHTHGCLDQLFGLLAACVRYVDLICDVPDLIAKIRMILDRIQIRKWIGEKARINVQYITSCRPWKTWLQQKLPVTFQGGMKRDSDGHHAFIFLRRADVPRNIIIKHDEKHGPLVPHEMDIICFVKRNASDHFLDQEAVLAMPYQFLQPILLS
ncbi:unnamed protein product [Cladocopium goreaui]|uniref:Sodium/hydrogen exchanger 3 n=1 Tax=Cladocopium goreaui TaxID=2562237 RepID=A0A9P1FFD9_9DINO|nr:unnamed protein product [Cladocopium goreaui]